MDIIDRSFLTGRVKAALDIFCQDYKLDQEFIDYVLNRVDLFDIFKAHDELKMNILIMQMYVLWTKGYNKGINYVCDKWEKVMAKDNAKKVLIDTIQETNKDIGKLPGLGFTYAAILFLACLGWFAYTIIANW